MLLVLCLCFQFVFFFSSRRRHTRFKCDWSSDVCSSDLSSERGDGMTQVATRSRPILKKFQADQNQRIARGEHLRTFAEYQEDQRCQALLIDYQARKYGKARRAG